MRFSLDFDSCQAIKHAEAHAEEGTEVAPAQLEFPELNIIQILKVAKFHASGQ